MYNLWRDIILIFGFWIGALRRWDFKKRTSNKKSLVYKSKQDNRLVHENFILRGLPYESICLTRYLLFFWQVTEITNKSKYRVYYCIFKSTAYYHLLELYDGRKPPINDIFISQFVKPGVIKRNRNNGLGRWVFKRPERYKMNAKQLKQLFKDKGIPFNQYNFTGGRIEFTTNIVRRFIFFRTIYYVERGYKWHKRYFIFPKTAYEYYYCTISDSLLEERKYSYLKVNFSEEEQEFIKNKHYEYLS